MPPLETQAASSYRCAFVSAADRVYGFAVFDEEQRRLQLCEYKEDKHLSRTEALLLQVHPQSCCILLQDPEDVKKMGRVAESCGVSVEDVKKEALKQVDIEQDLVRLLQDGSSCGLSRHLEEQTKKQGMKALCALLAHAQLLAEPSNFGSCTLGVYPLSSVMRLDKAAFSALNLLPRPDETNLRSNTTLLGFLNRCRSTIGTRLLRQWLTQPLTSAEQVSSRHDVVEAFVQDNELLRRVEGSFRYVPDLGGIAARLHRTTTKSKATKASLEDVITLYQCVRSTEPLAQVLQSYQGVQSAKMQSMLLDPLQQCLSDFKGFKALVEKTMDLKQAEQRTYCVNMDFDDALRQLAMQRDDIRQQMESLRDAVDRNLNLQKKGKEAGVALIEADQGQVFRVTKKHQQTVLNQQSSQFKYKALSIKKLELIFTVPQLEKLNSQLKAVLSAYDRQSSQLAEKALKIAATYCPVVERLGQALATVDVLAAFARTALNAPCDFVRPHLDPEGKEFHIKGAAHVLVLANSDRGFVANDLDMNKDTSCLHIITGPNMGGKSTYIRSVALIALMSQIGSFVPCQEATLPIFDAIMCRVGASDMQLRGISTFMAEMLEAACILNAASQRSLVIVDELGRGTSTSDGFGIAWAIARHLVEKVQCFSLFATHFHELAVLEEHVAAVRNRHATAAVDPASGKLTFLYSLAEGAADQSYGVHVAELAGFPESVVEAARGRAVEYEASAHFGRPAKRQRTGGEAATSPAAWQHVLGAAGEDDFVERALAQLPQLKAALAA
mmetsp:Transcript_27388/g.63929  ORF Transcript_27388/g.63929 Transcript_27388/m.63929 type:complete len:782 (+) Transcript_27388:48-2393(+)